LPSTRPDFGRPGVGSRPGISSLPAVGAGAIAGAGLANRIGERPGTLPGLGEGQRGPSQLPANRTPEQRRDALNDRLAGNDARPGQLPARDWNQQRQDWQQHRDQVRDDWQQHRDEARDDWQGWFDDHYGRYGGWYSGYAPGYWDRWDYLWDTYPVAAAVGLTWWGVNSMGYMLGCSDYYNPYYVETMPAVYSEPILTLPAEPAPEATASNEAVAKFDEVRSAFFEGHYDEALKLTDAAITKLPHDAVLHEFRSLILFALQRYADSCAAIHPVLDVGPGWDWKTMGSLYPSGDIYTGQLRALEAARNKHAMSADVHFLLGYHYLTCGHPDAALDMFRQAARLVPTDAVAASLVATLSPRDEQTSPPSAAAAPPAVSTDDLVGTWTATGRGDARYFMTLTKDGTFTWAFSRGSRKQEAKGVYALEGNVLAMEPDTGGVLLAELTLNGRESLQFLMVGGAKGDAGLDFRRGQ
jgi:tetratricopeptide (TPR) repeat protein